MSATKTAKELIIGGLVIGGLILGSWWLRDTQVSDDPPKQEEVAESPLACTPIDMRGKKHEYIEVPDFLGHTMAEVEAWSACYEPYFRVSVYTKPGFVYDVECRASGKATVIPGGIEPHTAELSVYGKKSSFVYVNC